MTSPETAKNRSRSWVATMLHSRFQSGVAAWLVAAARVIAGVVFVAVSTGKFADHAQEAIDFDRYGIPVPDVAVYAVGVLELVGGILLVVGLLTRPAAAALAVNMVGAISTAGRIEGGSFNLGLAPTLLAVMLLLLWVGSGRPALDPALERRVNIRDSAV